MSHLLANTLWINLGLPPTSFIIVIFYGSLTFSYLFHLELLIYTDSLLNIYKYIYIYIYCNYEKYHLKNLLLECLVVHEQIVMLVYPVQIIYMGLTFL